jgi:hypothetical protein
MCPTQKQVSVSDTFFYEGCRPTAKTHSTWWNEGCLCQCYQRYMRILYCQHGMEEACPSRMYGVGYLAWKWIRISLNSWMVLLMESGTKTKSYKLVSKIACVCVSFFLY